MSRGMDLCIAGAQVLIEDGLEDATVHISSRDGLISAIGADQAGARTLDGRGLLLLPGIVDIHGDAFERQIMPRPGVDIALDIALIDSDRQAIANGITTVFHGVTWSWEPGLRGTDSARDPRGNRVAAAAPRSRHTISLAPRDLQSRSRIRGMRLDSGAACRCGGF